MTSGGLLTRMRRLTTPAARVALPLALAAVSGTAAAATVLPDGFRDSTVVQRLDHPVGMAFLPDGRLLVVEQQSARMRLIVNGALSSTDPVAAIPDVQTAGAEQGLLGVAVDPGWPARPYLYVHCDMASAPAIRISRYTAGGDLAFTGDGHLTVDPVTRYDLLNDAPDSDPNHNGGTLRFGGDGMLYVSLGEDEQRCAAQDTVSLRGVILRLDVTRLPSGAGGPAPRSLITPPGNPFAAHPNPNARLVWALGLRNPFRFHVDPADGALFVADVGENDWEEIDRVPGGGHDYGWPAFEGPLATGASCANPIVPGDPPIHAYDRVGTTAAVIGGGVYRRPPGATAGFPAAYEGDYLFSDYYRGFLRRLKRSGSTWDLAPAVPGQPNATDWGTGFDEVSDYAVGPDGALWYVRESLFYTGNTGSIHRVVSTVPDTARPQPAFDFAPPRPTPARGAVALVWSLPAPAVVKLDIHDLFGRRVRRLVDDEAQSAGPHQRDWDGLDDDGRRVPPGLYLARLIAGGAAREHRIPLIR
ncbi:MAG: PQQ-dependent sugar dehydrogenase [Candidatus Eisenbacteria bacterium]|nr:PQQ-dependent sugar dehydrogenase [Candidatus Eisenbacteria bacterium]